MSQQAPQPSAFFNLSISPSKDCAIPPLPAFPELQLAFGHATVRQYIANQLSVYGEQKIQLRFSEDHLRDQLMQAAFLDGALYVLTQIASIGSEK